MSSGTHGYFPLSLSKFVSDMKFSLFLNSLSDWETKESASLPREAFALLSPTHLTPKKFSKANNHLFRALALKKLLLVLKILNKIWQSKTIFFPREQFELSALSYNKALPTRIRNFFYFRKFFFFFSDMPSFYTHPAKSPWNSDKFCYVWTERFLIAEKKSCRFKNIGICVDGA